MRPGMRERTFGALAAGLETLATAAADQRRSERIRELCLADAVRSLQQQRVRQPSAGHGRLEALARRPRALASPRLQVADLELDQNTREVRRGDERIELTPKEYAVLEYLMRHAGRVMSRTLITEYAWGYHFDPGTNIVDVVINHLRKKIDAGRDHRLIHTVRGVGYVVKA